MFHCPFSSCLVFNANFILNTNIHCHFSCSLPASPFAYRKYDNSKNVLTYLHKIHWQHIKSYDTVSSYSMQIPILYNKNLL